MSAPHLMPTGTITCCVYLANKGGKAMANKSLFPKDFAKQLEREIKESIEKDAKNHPEKFLDDHVGDAIPEKCKRCGQPKMVIIKGGKAKCEECGYTEKISVNLSWR